MTGPLRGVELELDLLPAGAAVVVDAEPGFDRPRALRFRAELEGRTYPWSGWVELPHDGPIRLRWAELTGEAEP